MEGHPDCSCTNHHSSPSVLSNSPPIDDGDQKCILYIDTLSIDSIHPYGLLLVQKGLEMWKNVRLVLEDDVSVGLIQWLLIIAAIAWG